MSEVKATDIILSDLPKERQNPGATFIFDDCTFNENDVENVAICDLKVSKEGTTATIMIEGVRTDKMVTHLAEIDSKSLTEKVRKYVYDFLVPQGDKHLGVAGGPIEPTKMDNVNEELLEEAEPAVSKSHVELMQKRGYVEGAILVISSGYDPVPEVSYGILTDIWEDDKHKTLYIRLTDGRIVEVVDCQIATDVNKHIIRMVEAEKGRMIENAIKFGEKMDNHLEKIIFE